MSTSVVMDRAGRVLVPKSLRSELQLEPGDSLTVERVGDQLTLRPERELPRLVKEQGVWVIQGTGQTMSASQVDELRDQIYREREDAFLNPVG